VSTSFPSTGPGPGGTVRSSAGRRRLGPIVIVGAVALLAAAIGLAAATFVFTSRASATGGAAAYVPPDATFYVELRVEPSPAQDAALRDLLGRFPAIEGLDLDRPLTDQLTEMLDAKLAGDGLELSWNEDVAPWTDGRLAVAVLELPAELMDPMAGPMAASAPPAVAMLGVTDADAAREAVGRIMDEAGAPETTSTEHRGVTINTAADDGAYAITDDQLIVAQSADAIAAALDTEASGETLAEREEVLAHVAALPTDWLAFGVFDMSDALGAALDAAGEADDAGAASLSRLLEHQSYFGAFTVTATDAGIAFDAAGPPATGPFAPEEAERSFASEVPGDALYYSEGGNLGEALTEMISVMKDAAASDPDGAAGIDTAESVLGAELEELVAWVGDGALAIGWDGEQPYGGLVLEATDVDAAQRRLDQLATFAGLAAMDPSTGITIEEAEVAGTTVTTITWSDASTEMVPMSIAGLAVQYAVTGDRVVVGVGDRFVGRVLELDAGTSLAADARYADAVASLGGPSTVGTTWIDIAGIVETTRPLLSELGVQMDGVEVGGEDPFTWLEPIDRLVTVGKLDGDVLVQRSVLFIR
jgi:hypothetical protein